MTALVAHIVFCFLVAPLEPQESDTPRIHEGAPCPEPVVMTVRAAKAFVVDGVRPHRLSGHLSLQLLCDSCDSRPVFGLSAWSKVNPEALLYS